ncbi:head GIN domain-containing protein [Leeuwenhoekiella aequorea]|uniref:head GIN domain-containing protein n=1 Tax=Leeuwenhoekiella aequorea TaxID=283736 RepID=UPI00352DC7DB
MKNIYYLVLFSFLALSCNSEKGLNCFQTEGDRVEQEFEVDAFEAIIIEERLQLIVKEGPVQKVVIATGENLLNDIEVTVTDGVLTVLNNNGCNLVRDFNISKVYVTSPNIKQIRNASGYEVQSDGVLSYPSLTLLSNDGEEEDFYHKDGDFRLQLDVNELNITADGLSNFYISGEAVTATINFLEGDIRFEGADFEIQNLNIFHRGTNKVIVNPIQALRGKVLSTGDLISVNRPPIVDIEETYTGKLIFQD